MSGLLLRDYLSPGAATASSAAANYPATAAMVPGVLRGWRSTAGSSQWLQFDLGSNMLVSAAALQAYDTDAVFSTITVLADTINPPSTVAGNIAIGIDGNGRRKGSVSFAPILARYVRFNFTAFTGTYHAVGSAFLFATSTSLPVDPLYGQTSFHYIDPQVRDDLPNGVTEVYSAGAATTEISLAFGPRATDDVELVRRAARAGPCWLDLGLGQRGRQWPIRHVEADTQRRIDRINRESIGITLREIT